MGKRQQRFDAIRAIVRTHEVRTQRELADLLTERGFDCTQATVSRDVMDMRLGKTEGGCYITPEDLRFSRLMSTMVNSVQAAGNIVVFKTPPGTASGVCAALDDSDLEGIVGTVAGDDTIFLVAESPEMAKIIEEEACRLRR